MDQPLDKGVVADSAASFQAAVVDVLVAKSLQACRQKQAKRLLVGGGVAANQLFRQTLSARCHRQQIELLIPPLEWCTDNAAMAAIAIDSYYHGDFADLSLDVLPGLLR